jgi:hypothetical protein
MMRGPCLCWLRAAQHGVAKGYLNAQRWVVAHPAEEGSPDGHGRWGAGRAPHAVFSRAAAVNTVVAIWPAARHAALVGVRPRGGIDVGAPRAAGRRSGTCVGFLGSRCDGRLSAAATLSGLGGGRTLPVHKERDHQLVPRRRRRVGVGRELRVAAVAVIGRRVICRRPPDRALAVRAAPTRRCLARRCALGQRRTKLPAVSGHGRQWVAGRGCGGRAGAK